MRIRAVIQEDYRPGRHKDVVGNGDYSRSLIEIEIQLDIRDLLIELNTRLAWQNRDDPPDSLDMFAGKMVDRLHQTVKPGPLGKP